MPSLKKYKSFTRSLSVPLSTGDTLTISYRPAAYNGAFHKKNTDGGAPLSDEAFLLQILAGWDFTDEKEKIVPITAQAIAEDLSIQDRGACVRAIFDDLFPNDGRSMSSNSVSASTDTDAALGRS